MKDYSVAITDLEKDLKAAKEYTRDRHYESAAIYLERMHEHLLNWRLHLLALRKDIR